MSNDMTVILRERIRTLEAELAAARAENARLREKLAYIGKHTHSSWGAFVDAALGAGQQSGEETPWEL